jgi:hypothetical protein
MSMARFGKTAFVLFAVLLLLTFTFLPQAGAQTPSNEGWHLEVSPYLWLAGIHGTVGALGNEVSVHAGFDDIFSNMNIGLMSAVETRYNRIVMPVDFMWLSLSDEKALPGGLAVTSIKADLTQVILAPKIGYRFVNSDKVKVDALTGFRYWHMGTTLTPQPGGPAPSDSANWVDALAGAKLQAQLATKLHFIAMGDIGGGGANSDYQIAGGLGYQLSRKWTLSAGYRYMAVNYRPNTHVGFVNDTVTSGILVGATWNIK